MHIASFRKRILAFLLDYFFVGYIFSGVVSFIFMGEDYFFTSPRTLKISLIISLIFPAYKMLGEWKYGHTIGKRIMSMKVVSQEYTSITFKQSVTRNGYLVLYFVIPHLVMLLFHDQLFDFNETKGGNMAEVIIDNAIGLFQVIITFIIIACFYFIYSIVWLLIIFMSAINAVDNVNKQTFFDVMSKTLTVFIQKETLRIES
ncbi:RDD family protein [Winogradskyella sp. 3972H.M.0a.05]|uniref:RDD family protein n=1 Tax=Winogradskyella sp. 3972H.M.0a.05 TaxID=2950277 RepID=UPI00339AF3CE